MLGFKEGLEYEKEETTKTSHNFKLVPWLTWDEWKFVRVSLFSSDSDSVSSALRRVSAWKSRGCVPVEVEVTASIIEIQQQDPFFRNELIESASQSEEMLAMLYCMAIIRFLNGVVEKTRDKNKTSVGRAAEDKDIPRMITDIRHESSHRDLPSLQLVRLASSKTLDWLISYYWEPQEKAILSQNDQTINTRKEIKRKLREVARCLKAKHAAKSSPSHVNGKHVRQTEHKYGLNKLLFHVAGKSPHSSSAGSKNQVNKSLKKSLENVLRLYSSFSPEVVSIMLEFLLNALDSSKLVNHVEDSQSDHSTDNKQTAYDEWRSVVLRLSRKEPEFLLSLIQALLEKMESQGATIDLEIGLNESPESAAKSRQIDLLLCVFEWLIGSLKTLNHGAQKESAVENEESMKDKWHLPKATILGLIQRCLLISSPINKRLMTSAIDLAHLAGEISLLQKLKKLASVRPSNPDTNTLETCSRDLLSNEEDSFRRAEEKFALIIRRRQKQSNDVKTDKCDVVGVKRKWVLAKSWNPCPIGMLPHTDGSSGRLPVLDCNSVVKLSDNEENIEVNECGKRVAESCVQEIDNTFVKKAKELEAKYVIHNHEDTFEEGVKGHFVIDGVWKKVGEEEMLAIPLSVRSLV